MSDKTQKKEIELLLDSFGVKSWYVKRIADIMMTEIDKAHLSGRDSMRIECVEVARSYKPKLKDKGVEVSDGGIFVDYNEAIASALKKIKL